MLRRHRDQSWSKIARKKQTISQNTGYLCKKITFFSTQVRKEVMTLCPLPKREELATCSYDKMGFQFMVRKTYFLEILQLLFMQQYVYHSKWLTYSRTYFRNLKF